MKVKVNVMYSPRKVIRRLMGSVCKDKDETQWDNIFHTSCMVMGKICSLIIDEGSLHLFS